MYVVTGDRHWQYVSVDSKTGVREYSCGPASDQHAGGYRMDQRRPEHMDNKPVLIFRHYSVDGKILNEDRLQAR